MKLSGLIRMLKLVEKRRSKQYEKDFYPRCYRTDYECDYPLSAEINSIVEFESGRIFLSEEGLEREYEFSRDIKLHDNCFSIKEDKIVSKIGVTWLLVQGERYLFNRNWRVYKRKRV